MISKTNIIYRSNLQSETYTNICEKNNSKELKGTQVESALRLYFFNKKQNFNIKPLPFWVEHIAFLNLKLHLRPRPKLFTSLEKLVHPDQNGLA